MCVDAVVAAETGGVFIEKMNKEQHRILFSVEQKVVLGKTLRPRCIAASRGAVTCNRLSNWALYQMATWENPYFIISGFRKLSVWSAKLLHETVVKRKATDGESLDFLPHITSSRLCQTSYESSLHSLVTAESPHHPTRVCQREALHQSHISVTLASNPHTHTHTESTL